MPLPIALRHGQLTGKMLSVNSSWGSPTSADMMPLAQSLYVSLGYEPMQVYRTDIPWPGIRWLKKEL